MQSGEIKLLIHDVCPLVINTLQLASWPAMKKMACWLIIVETALALCKPNWLSLPACQLVNLYVLFYIHMRLSLNGTNSDKVDWTWPPYSKNLEELKLTSLLEITVWIYLTMRLICKPLEATSQSGYAVAQPIESSISYMYPNFQ